MGQTRARSQVIPSRSSTVREGGKKPKAQPPKPRPILVLLPDPTPAAIAERIDNGDPHIPKATERPPKIQWTAAERHIAECAVDIVDNASGDAAVAVFRLILRLRTELRRNGTTIAGTGLLGALQRFLASKITRENAKEVLARVRGIAANIRTSDPDAEQRYEEWEASAEPLLREVRARGITPTTSHRSR